MSDLTKTGTAIGSPEYMAPELFRSTRADPRSDVYSLGAVMYEMLAGRPPYVGDSLAAIMTQQLESEAPPLSELRDDLPHWIQSVIEKCLRIDPDARYQSAAELLTELAREERALSVYEDLNQATLCLHCKSQRVPGLPFCHDCGKFTHEVFEPGDCSLVIYKADEPELLADALAKVFPQLDARRVEKRLSAGPALLVRGVGEATASSLHNELAALYCQISIVRSLPRELQLPGWLAVPGLALFAALYSLLGQLLDLPIATLGGRPVVVGALALLGSQAAILAYYRRRTRSLVSVASVRSHAGSKPSALALRLAQRIGEVHLASARRTLGHMASDLLALAEAHPSWAATDLRAVEELFVQSCRAAQKLERFELYLSARSLMEIKDRLDMVKIKLARSAEAHEIEGWIAAKADLQQELDEFREVEDLHARVTMALLSAGGTLAKLRDGVRSGEPCLELGDEIRLLSQNLCAEGERTSRSVA